MTGQSMVNAAVCNCRVHVDDLGYLCRSLDRDFRRVSWGRALGMTEETHRVVRLRESTTVDDDLLYSQEYPKIFRNCDICRDKITNVVRQERTNCRRVVHQTVMAATHC